MPLELNVSTTTLRVMVEEVERRGIDANPLLSRCGLHRRSVFNPLARAPRANVLDFVRAAQVASDDPVLHVAASANSAPGVFAIADYVTVMAPTIGAGYTRILDRFHLVNPAMGFTIDVQPQRVVARSHPVHVAASDPIEIEATFMALAVRLQQMTSGAHAPIETSLAYPQPDNCRLEPYFPCPVRFGAADNAMSFDRAAWAARSHLANRELSDLLVYLSEPLLRESRLGPDLERIERALVASIASGRLDMASVARLLGTSVRTLQRRLRQLGTSFSKKLDDVRHNMAIEALRSGVESVTQIALGLGFSETSAFSRAFKRWTGRSPTKYQRNLNTQASD